jgi:diguanylate cyclase (GGDEF)-like protein
MTSSQVPPSREIVRLPKQSVMPSLEQLHALLKECTQSHTKSFQLPFGDAPEDCYLAVFSDRAMSTHWALFRGDGPSSMLLWEQISTDPRHVQRLIIGQFPWMAAAPADQQYAKSAFLAVAAEAAPAERKSAVAKGKATLEGDLREMQMPNILQSISMSRATGRLEVANLSETAVVFVRDGKPIHCTLPTHQGTSALLEVVGWDDGEFHFYPENKQRQQTITKRLDTILMEGAALDDKLKFLKTMGCTENCYPVAGEPTADVDKLEAELLEADVDLGLAQSIFDKIDGRTRLIDVVAAAGLPKTEWVPALLVLATFDIVRFEAAIADPVAFEGREAKIDWSEARNLERHLLRTDTGLHSYAAFLLALENEYKRWTRFRRPFAVAILDIAACSDDPRRLPEPLFAASIKEVAIKINETRRESDLLAHYETFKFAMLLPETNHVAATRFADRLTESINGMALGEPSNGLRLTLRLGIACIPDDCSTLGALLAIARPARNAGI